MAQNEQSDSKVMVFYTGGTIGMMKNDNDALEPAPGELLKFLRKFINDADYGEQKYGKSDSTPLILPHVNGAKFRVAYEIKEYSPLLDSSNMRMEDWGKIAKDIEAHYKDYHGFVILHGTDTLAYTASALSFMLENLGKTVIVTGAQIPIFEPNTDGKDNFLFSVMIAGNHIVPEVCVLFGGKLLRGNRTTKVSSESLSAFDSMNAPPLGTISTEVKLDTHSIFRPCDIDSFRVHDKMEENIGILRLFPSIAVSTIGAALADPIKGVLLQSFGSGNVPSDRQDIMDKLKEATDRGVIVLNTSQCPSGSVSTDYETGKVLSDLGVIQGYDMTQEAALCKLAYVLSRCDLELDEKKKMMQTNLRGEMTTPKSSETLEKDLVEAIAQTLKLSTPQEKEIMCNVIYPALVTAAVAEGDTQKLDSLKSCGADICAGNFDDRTALHLACFIGKEEIVKYLLNNGCSVYARDRFNRTPLHEAMDTDNHDIIKILIQAGAHLPDPPESLGDILCALAERRAMLRLESFRLAGVDLQLPDRTGRTPMHVAAALGHKDLIEYLLPYYKDIHVKDKLGYTPQDYAKRANKENIVALFDEQEAS